MYPDDNPHEQNALPEPANSETTTMASDTTDDSAESIVRQMENVNEQLQELRRQFAQKIGKDNTQRQAFDRLYAEMRQYKDNFIFEALRPILIDLVLLHDNMARMEKHIQNSQALGCIGNLKEELLEALYRQDVEPIQRGESDKLDRKTQRVIKTITTDVAEENGQVVEVVRQGFLRNDRVLRPQEVICKRYQPQSQQKESSL